MKKIMMIIMAVVLMALPIMAQQQEPWQSTSVMPTSGSAYRSPITAVGATQAVDMGTTTSSASYSPGRPGHIRREQGVGDGRTPGEASEASEQSPVGEPWVLLVFAVAFAGYTAVRKRQAHKA